MEIRQISIQLENKPGQLSRISELLGKEGINLGAISIADTADSSVIRIIADDPDKAMQVLGNAGFSHAKFREVIAVETPDHPGGLSAILRPLAQAKINVLYLYPYLRRIRGNAILIFRVSDEDLENAYRALRESWIQILDEEIYSL